MLGSVPRRGSTGMVGFMVDYTQDTRWVFRQRPVLISGFQSAPGLGCKELGV